MREVVTQKESNISSVATVMAIEELKYFSPVEPFGVCELVISDPYEYIFMFAIYRFTFTIYGNEFTN